MTEARIVTQHNAKTSPQKLHIYDDILWWVTEHEQLSFSFKETVLFAVIKDFVRKMTPILKYNAISTNVLLCIIIIIKGASHICSKYKKVVAYLIIFAWSWPERFKHVLYHQPKYTVFTAECCNLLLPAPFQRQRSWQGQDGRPAEVKEQQPDKDEADCDNRTAESVMCVLIVLLCWVTCVIMIKESKQ